MSTNETYTDPDVVKHLEAPMPWIGMYAAAASLICTLAMAADAQHGFASRKYWFPSKYFSLNATTLTLLAVAMKLPMDLTTKMYYVTDRLSTLSSLVFMSTAIANFLTSLGSMNDKNMLMNVAALGILVITVIGNVFIQIIQMHSHLKGRLAFYEEVLAIASMFLLLVMLISSALMIPSTKRYLETKYREMRKSALDEEQFADARRLNADKLRVLVKKYWLMAETSSPQFVIARSVTCTAAGVLSFFIALVLLEAEVRMAITHKLFDRPHSIYKWSTKWILLSQSIGVIVGSIAPASRWFVAVIFRSLDEGHLGITRSLAVEDYWTQKMVEWRESLLSVQIQHFKSRKLLHDMKGLLLKLCISVQYLIVLASKLVLFISVYMACPLISSLRYIARWRRRRLADYNLTKSSVNLELDIRHYAMLLEGEVELPIKTLLNIFTKVDQVIEKGRMQNPKSLLKLLYKSCSFRGVTEFDQEPTLHSQDLPYCWSLPVVTLTCISLALPNIEKAKSNCLLNSVTEGFRFVRLIDKTLDSRGGLANIRNAADVVWVKVELYHKWQDKDLQEASIQGKNAEEILKQLQEKAEKTISEFKRDATSCVMRNPLNWPAKVIAANSMLRVSRTILMDNVPDEGDKTDDDLFEKLSIMIADILTACFTNLARVITMKCHHSGIEERETSVHEAAVLLGEMEDIIALVQQRELPMLEPEQAAYIDEWRALIKLDDNQEFFSMPIVDTTNHITIEVDG